MTTGAKEQGRGVGGISRPTAFWLAWSLWALSVALTALSLVLLALIRAHPGIHVFDFWLGNSLVVIDVTVGAIVASRRPENPVGWLLCLSGVAPLAPAPLPPSTPSMPCWPVPTRSRRAKRWPGSLPGRCP